MLESISIPARLTLALALALCAAALLPGAASAAKNCQGGTTAPPGNNSEVDQYYETVPNGCSDGQINPPSANDGSGEKGGAVPPQTAAQLEELGKDGRATLNLANSGSPGTISSNQFSGGRVPDANDGGLGNFFGGIVGSLGGSGTAFGWLLPLVLIAIAVGGAYYLLARRRSKPS